ncbi:MAG: gliding motility-associated C-terminal domain-containing protein [Flavobacteriales bacterium]|nr:gliding motility-associated C-terminal domain-containing protein [Flavobacteriales bacterium]
MKNTAFHPSFSLRLLVIACALSVFGNAQAQRIKYWTAGSGAWSDAAHWSLAANGAGGAGVPRANEEVVIAAQTAVEVLIDRNVVCSSLSIDASNGPARLIGSAEERLRITGDLQLIGDVEWRYNGPVEFTASEGQARIDTRGVLIASDVVIDGDAQWDLTSALNLADDAALVIKHGTLRTNDGVLKLGSLRAEGHGSKRFEAGGSIILLKAFEPQGFSGNVDQGSSTLILNGQPVRWDGSPIDPEEFQRGITNCGTGAGQTPFQVNAQVTSNYNGFGVRCNGACDGAVTVTITGGSGNFGIQWQGGPSGTGTSLPWANICAGNKLVIVTDLGQNVGCFASVLVTPPPPLGVLFFGLNPPTCADVCNGTAVTFPGGGAGFGYDYNWNNGVENTSNPVQLCSGVNTLQLTDANNCVYDTSFTIDLLPVLALLSNTQASCFGDCSGTAHVEVSGGTPAYTYNWQPGDPAGDGTADVTGLCAGSWSVLVSDFNGCDTTINFLITQPAPIVPNPSHTDATCSNTCDGTAGVAPSGSVGPYTYDWSPDPIQGDGTPNVTGLCAGDYTVLITDVPSGCDTLVTITIASPPTIDVQLATTNATCSGVCDGSADIIITGGTPGYVIQWAPGVVVGQGTLSVSQLCAGNYTVTVTDLIGCDTTIAFIITEPPPILPNETISEITCAGTCDGAISVAAGYTYDWTPTPPNGDFQAIATGLCPNTWTVLVSDGACDTLLTLVLADPIPITIVPAQTSVSCGNNCDATASAVVSGGNDPYSYSWSPPPGGGQGTPNVTGLCAGTYTLTVVDSVDCTVTLDYTILPPVPLQVSIATVNATCPDFCNGSASATVTGGNDPYTYLWAPLPGGGQGTASATGLCAQDYTLTVTDSVGCDTTIVFTISAPLPIDPNAIVVNNICSGECTGSIVLAPTGGFGNFTYTWTPPPPNGPGTAQALNLCSGTWQVVVASGVCDTVLVFQISEPPPIQANLTTTPVTCGNDCDGTATSNTTGGTVGYTWTWNPAPAVGQGTQNAVGFCAGPHTLTIVDAVGCDTVISFNIDAPPPLVPLLSTTLASCGGLCDGSATVSFSGGTGPVDVVWFPEPGGGQNTTAATEMCPGLWSVTLTDSLGCDTTLQFTINTPSGIIVAPTVTDVSCGDLCDGEIELDISGGVPTYSISWSPTPPVGGGTSISGLCAGQWTAIITDQAACDTVLVIDVGGPAPILPNGVFTNETCNGPCDGTASVNPTGGTGSFVYSWNPAPPIGNGTSSVGGLCAGDWCVTITDVTGCDTTWCFTILSEQPILANLTIQDATCPGTCNGAASVAPTGGVPGYSYDWSPEPAVGQGTADVSGLCLGFYTVTISDAAGCDTTLSFFISKPAPITTSLAFSAADCTDPCSAEAASFPSGGNGGYTFLWQPAPSTGQGTFFVTGLCADSTYTLIIADSLGCDTSESFTVPAFTPIDPNFSTTPESCAGSCDGTATLGVTGGEGPYTYDWSPDPISGDGTPSVTGLCAGTYSVLIADANGCDTLVSILITGPPPILLFPIVQNVRCNGECNGSIVVNSAGGTGPFTYLWTPQPPIGQGTAFAQQLCAGTWSVLITDSAGCDTTFTATLVDPPVFSVGVLVTESECQACIGAIQLDPNGAGPFNFNWGPPIGQSTPDSVQTGLCAGLYPVIAIDAFGCAVQLDVPVSDSNGEVLSTTDDNVTCPTDCDGTVSVSYNCSTPLCMVEWYDPSGFPLFLTTDTISGLCAGVYFVQVMNSDGCITFDTAQVFAPEPMVLQIGTTPESCAGSCDGTAGFGISGGIAPYTIFWDPAPATGQGTPSVTGLCAGTYSISVTDNSGCSITANVLILGPQPIAANALVQDISCAGSCDGMIDLNTQGGTGSYQYTWDPVPPNGQGTDSASMLCTGTWSVNITDGNGCDTAFAFIINEPQPIALIPSSTSSNCLQCNGTATVQISGGTGSVSVTWTDVNNVIVGAGPALTDLCAGIYTATALDTNGCSAQVVVVISDGTGEQLSITNGQTTCANNCDGEVAVSFNCTSGPCEITWYTAQAQPLGFNVFSLDSLCVGLYLVQVDNGAGCTVIDTAIVSPSQVLIPNLSTAPVSCHGLCDGTATVGPQGGAGTYVFDWAPDPITGDGTSSVSGLCAGVYTVSITDASGCDTTINVLITEPDAITTVSQVTDNSCNGSCDGSITLLVSGGSGAIIYSWNPQPPIGQGSNAVSQLCAGDWTVIIVDSLGCDTSITFNITEPQPLVLNTASTQSTCGICSGTVSASTTGGSAPYLYAWTLNGALYGTDSLLVDVCAGLYLVTVTDANGCQLQQSVPVSDADGEDVITTDDIVTCPGSCDGEVTASFVCGTTPCSITWFNSLGLDLNESGNALDSLCAGLYFVQVTNGNGCITIDTAAVTEPLPIQPNLSTTPTSCYNTCDGAATVSPTGGVAPYVYDWEPGLITGDSTASVSDLCGVNYAVVITDSVGCSVTVDVLILSPQPLSASAIITPITCNSSCDGAITLIAQGGTGNPAFTWTPPPPVGQNTPSISQLCADIWTVVITDVNGCDTTYSYPLFDPPELTVQLSTTSNDCFGDCAGTATATISGGTGSYSIEWSTSGGGFINNGDTAIIGLCAGDYVVTVTDSSGCSVSTPFNIGQGVAISAGLIFTGETCLGPCDATAQITPTGGTGSFNIIWFDPNGVVFAQDTTQISNVCAGNWTVAIVDSLGCDSTFGFTVLPYTSISATAVVTQVQCNGACDGSITITASGGTGSLVYAWQPVPPNGDGTNVATGLCPNSYSVTITDNVGCDTTLTFLITEPAPISISLDQVIDASCSSANDGAISTTVGGGTPSLIVSWVGPNNYTGSGDDIANLAPGSYTVTVVDANNCTDQQVVVVAALSTVVANAGVDVSKCFGAGVVLDGSLSTGGFLFGWTDAQGNPISAGAQADLGILQPGSYTYILSVSDGPCADQDTVEVIIVALPFANAGPDQDIFLEGSALLGGQPSGPIGSSFLWFPDSLVSNATAPNPTTSPDVTTQYIITVTANGCSNTDTVLITVVPEIVIPSGFTPTGDGANDTWQIDNIDQFIACTVEVYNRWGELLFSSTGYKDPWDGTYNGAPVPVGTYYYAIELNDERFPDPYTGPLTVIR